MLQLSRSAPGHQHRRKRFGCVHGAASVIAVSTFMLGIVHAAQAQPQSCVGDCNGDGRVAIGELITGVNVSLGLIPAALCAAMDENTSGDVSIAELVTAINNALGGCPPPATTTETRTSPASSSTPEPSRTPDPSGIPPCVLSEESTLTLNTANFPIRLTDLDGEIAISCEGLDGDLSCLCNLRRFEAITIGGIGELCVGPFAGCDQRPLSCDGGLPIDVNFVGDHNIGECAGRDDCASKCGSHCASMGDDYIAQSSACEDFCIGGRNDDMACTLDADCPGGSCPGADGDASGPICGCTCAHPGAGEPAANSGLSCTLGLAFSIEIDGSGVCGDIPPAINLPPVCGEMTTARSIGRLLNVNNSNGETIGPTALMGTPLECNAFASGSRDGLQLVGHLAFYGTQLGDFFVENSFVCE